ncbi:hypothetical protein RHGRI_000959 [Rhododendron griersonianum]|uniref:Sulfotransferase n=1 Tax=Rhododendron griersonianum TaxID=479676 RepID=A0AAV6LLC1_9ERIC|nr:hypothetical protein RHGRI_000959 [Rhododendron griersonianum]
MKRDTSVKMKRLTDFLGQPFSMEEDMEHVVEDIIKLCSFHTLRNLRVDKSGYAIHISRMMRSLEKVKLEIGETI